MTPLTVANFLRQERLESYKEDLAALGAMTVNDLLALTQDDLDLVGMKKVSAASCYEELLLVPQSRG